MDKLSQTSGAAKRKKLQKLQEEKSKLRKITTFLHLPHLKAQIIQISKSKTKKLIM